MQSHVFNPIIPMLIYTDVNSNRIFVKLTQLVEDIEVIIHLQKKELSISERNLSVYQWTLLALEFAIQIITENNPSADGTIVIDNSVVNLFTNNFFNS